MSNLRPDPGPPSLLAPSGASNPWDWHAVSPEDSAEAEANLAKFVAYLNSRYAWTVPQTVPECWSRHGALIEELTTLMWSRWSAFSGPMASAEAAQTWHSYTLPLFFPRVGSWMGGDRAAAECRAGNHKPSGLPSAGRRAEQADVENG